MNMLLAQEHFIPFNQLLMKKQCKICDLIRMQRDMPVLALGRGDEMYFHVALGVIISCMTCLCVWKRLEIKPAI